MTDRVRIALVCDECNARNYQTTKPVRVGHQERLTLKKFCPTCRRHDSPGVLESSPRSPARGDKHSAEAHQGHAGLIGQ
ncbi:MAG: 50S ribosomal protein L33 [Sandaracinaceae bacterium]|nr:50S ribosomal protein L33 [Sandaracinaceae bacterium]